MSVCAVGSYRSPNSGKAWPDKNSGLFTQTDDTRLIIWLLKWKQFKGKKFLQCPQSIISCLKLLWLLPIVQLVMGWIMFHDECSGLFGLSFIFSCKQLRKPPRMVSRNSLRSRSVVQMFWQKFYCSSSWRITSYPVTEICSVNFKEQKQLLVLFRHLWDVDIKLLFFLGL